MAGALRIPVLLRNCSILIESLTNRSKLLTSRSISITGTRFTSQQPSTEDIKNDEALDVLQLIGEKFIGKVDLSDGERKLALEIDRLNKETVISIEKMATYEDKYKRALADGENLRVRLSRQIEDAKQFGIQSFCKDLLDVADILGHATKSVPKEEISTKNPHLKNLYEGLAMTNASLQQVFKRHGLEAINPVDEKFDPNIHEALFLQQMKDTEPNTVIVVTKVGYKLHGRCIRPALVGVSRD